MTGMATLNLATSFVPDAGLPPQVASILRIPVCMHNMEDQEIFRPGSWNAFGMDKEGSDYRACKNYGPVYR